MNIDFSLYSIILKGSYLAIIIPTLLVFISATMSAKEMGGTLGKALKKIAIGTIIDSSLIVSYLLLEKGSQGLLTEAQVRFVYLFSAIFASTFLIIGYVQIYKISKKLKLFTP